MRRYKLFLNGEFVESSSGKMIKVINPANEEVISEVPEATIEETKKAIDAAYEAQKKWEKLPAIERAKYFKKDRRWHKKKR